MSSLLRLERQQKRFLKLCVEFAYFSFFLIYNTFIHFLSFLENHSHFQTETVIAWRLLYIMKRTWLKKTSGHMQWSGAHYDALAFRFSPIRLRFSTPRGGTPENSWWGCAARFSKSWPLFQTKKCNFPHPFSDQTSKIHTRFQTWPLSRNYVIIT